MQVPYAFTFRNYLTKLEDQVTNVNQGHGKAYATYAPIGDRLDGDNRNDKNFGYTVYVPDLDKPYEPYIDYQYELSDKILDYYAERGFEVKIRSGIAAWDSDGNILIAPEGLEIDTHTGFNTPTIAGVVSIEFLPIPNWVATITQENGSGEQDIVGNPKPDYTTTMTEAGVVVNLVTGTELASALAEP
jgi:hypothetical protein